MYYYATLILYLLHSLTLNFKYLHIIFDDCTLMLSFLHQVTLNVVYLHMLFMSRVVIAH